jgi:acyl-coenzyme A thioesterase PaaI-like protein
VPHSLQEEFAPLSICFGCGPANDGGLHVRSFVEGDAIVAEWTPAPHHEAFRGMLNGGVIGTLLDCHCNWAASHHLMVRDRADKPPCTVTAEYTIRMAKPTPTGAPVRLRARVVESSGSRVTVEGELEAGGRVTATCRGVFVAVEPGHPAYHQW